MEMESPNSSKPQSTDTSPAQESPVFSYISNLSPLVEKASTVTQDFQGLGSPPLVFTSPRHKFQTQTTYLKRAIFHGLSATQLSRQNECCEENSVSPTECQYSTDVVNMDSTDSNCPSESTTKSSEYVHQPRDAKGTKEPSVNVDDEHNKRITEEIATSLPPLIRQTEDEDKEDSTIDATVIETEVKDMDVISDHCIKTGQELSLVHAVTNQELEVPAAEFRHQNHWEEENAGQGFPLDQSSHLLSESTQIGEDSGNFVEAAVATLSKPALEVTQHRGILRHCLQFDDAQNQKVTPNYTAHNPEDSMGPQSLKKPLRLANEKWDVTLQPVSYPKNNSSLNVMVQKPIGLHLNKIVNLGQSESGSITEKSRARTSSFTIRGNKLIPIINSPSDSGLSRTDDHRSFSTYTIKTLNHPVALSPVEDESTPSNKRKFNNVIDGVSEEFNKSSVKKKRKTSSDLNDSNGCKRCNCKKSNCLKLYCDCFAAGIYCAGSCACVACLNRPQYEETVLDKRQQIESRNPLAFAPKVVKHLTQPLESSFENNQSLFTPSSARHKRGCNCKKSMCMKKYCECYQANVGCSDGCRCEGCQNVFGRKGDLGMKDVTNDECTGEKADGSSGENFKLLSSGNSLYSSELLNPHHLTPPTPAFQFTDHRKDASEAWFPSGKYVQSPSPDCNAKISETNNEIRDMASFDPTLHYGGNAETVNDFSSENMKFTSDISNHLISANSTKVESFPANRQYSSATSCHWHGSPNTPVASHSGTANYLQVSMQEDTTYVLIDTPTSQDNVKVISPAKKRVSPPRLTEFGSSSSGGVRTGRKFILKAVPSFPPLTPCVSKTAGVEPTDDPQIRSNNN